MRIKGGLSITKLLNSLTPFGFCAKKSLTDLSSNTILSDLSVNNAISSGFNFVESFQLETTSLTKWFFSSLCSHFSCNTSTNIFNFCWGPWEDLRCRQCITMKQGGMGYHFFHREGVRTSVRGEVEAENHEWQSRLYSLWSKSVVGSLCALAHVPQLKDPGSRDHPSPLGSQNQEHITPSICRPAFLLLDFVGVWVWETAGQLCSS